MKGMNFIFSDIDSFTESSDSEDQDSIEFVYEGQACSILSSLEESLGQIDDIFLFERGFIHGDIVCSVKEPAGQMGKVINVDIIADLENMNGIKIQAVNSKDLKRIRSLSVGDYVVNGPWLGKIEKIVDRVTVLFPDGTMSEFSMTDPETLVPISLDLMEDPQNPFYPGQTVLVKKMSFSNSTGWFDGMRKNNRKQGTVCSVDAGDVFVCWLGCALVAHEKLPSPSCLQDSKNFSLLSCFPHENWELGDWCLLQDIDYNDDKTCDFLNAHQKQNLGQNLPDIAVITKKKIKVDVLWQDGSYSMGLDPKVLISISLIDPHDFWPGQIVVEKETSDGDTPPSIHEYGVVKSVDAMDRTVKIKWTSVALDQSTKIGLQKTEEIVSAYELTEHPDYSYNIGDAVFRLNKGSLSNCSEKEACGANLNNVDNDYLHNNLPSSIGIVAGLKDGYAEVKWASGGVTEKVAPYEISALVKCESLPSIMPITATDEQSNEEIPDLDYQFREQREKGKANVGIPNENARKKLYRSSSCSLPQAATELLTHIYSFLFDSFHTYLLGGYKHLSEDKEEIETVEVPESHTMLPGDTIVTDIGITMDIDAGAIKDEEVGEESGVAPHGKMVNEHFARFDMVNDCSDHHFADCTGNSLESSQVKQLWLKKVQKEWSILERDLPETIYVRVYEERMDLLRAAIVGSQGTPYHDLLFFFDFYLPPEYPNEAPIVYYNSGGLRINPNLYESGKVCLSLLNTWAGSGSEVWNPKSSNILQILLSLQALVLNEKPYFNEAGYDLQIGTPEAEKNSISYNENAFVVSCRSLLYLIRRPPKHFEELVKEHINRRGKNILLACKAYIEGSPVGSAFEDVKVNRESITGSSMGFKIMVRKIFPKLVEAFSVMGKDCGQLFDHDV